MNSKIILLCSALPYLGFTAYDLWMHKHDRPVPKIEELLHNIILPANLAFLTLATFGMTLFAYIAMAIALPCMLADEFIYHQKLHHKEKIIHLAAGLSLASFAVVWQWMI